MRAGAAGPRHGGGGGLDSLVDVRWACCWYAADDLPINRRDDGQPVLSACPLPTDKQLTRGHLCAAHGCGVLQVADAMKKGALRAGREHGRQKP